MSVDVRRLRIFRYSSITGDVLSSLSEHYKPFFMCPKRFSAIVVSLSLSCIGTRIAHPSKRKINYVSQGRLYFKSVTN